MRTLVILLLLAAPANAQVPTRTEMMQGCYNTYMEQLRLSKTWHDADRSPEQNAHQAMLYAFKTQFDRCLSRATR
jgi:hypothetical protein